MTISGERTEQLHIFCRVTGFTSDFLSFIDVELIRFFHGALQLHDLHELLSAQLNIYQIIFLLKEVISMSDVVTGHQIKKS